MTKKQDAYQKIAEKWGFAKSESFRKMLEALFTLEEGELLLEATTPVTVPELSKRLKADEKSLAEKMDNFAKRGLIFRGKTEYRFGMGVHFGFAFMMHNAPEYTPSEEYRRWARQWAEENPNREVDSFLKRYKETGHQIHRVYPSRLAILSNPEIKKEQLLWHEDVEQIFRRAEIIGVVDCPCRINRQACIHPLWNCFHFTKEGVEFDVGRGARMKKISPDFAIGLSDDAERAGLIHEGPTNMAAMPGVLCSCCACACGMLTSSLATGRIHELYTPSRFQASVEPEKCNGCQTCVDRCPFDAIEMVKVAGSKTMKAHVMKEECFGCGVCVVGCPQEAIKYNLVRPPEHIPPAPERPMRMSAPLK